MKKIVSLFLALVMLVSTVAVNAFADTPNLSMSVDKSVVSEGEKGVRTKSWTKQRPQGGSRYIVHIRKESPRPAII